MTTLIDKPVCGTHGCKKEWRDCYNCGGEGVYGHECGEDTCCCLDPVDNERCDICRGKEGWWQCFRCAPWED